MNLVFRLLLLLLTLVLGSHLFLRAKREDQQRHPLPPFQVKETLFSLNKPLKEEKSSLTTPFYREETIDPSSTYAFAHEATLTELPNGKLLALWYAGSGELEGDVALYLTEKERGDSHWSAPHLLLTREEAMKELGFFVKALGNALIFSTKEGELLLLYVTVSLGRWSGSQLNLKISNDGGKTWSQSEHLRLSPFFNLSELVRHPPLSANHGSWIVPLYQEFLGKFPEILLLSPLQNGGWSLQKSRAAGGASFFQPSLIAFAVENLALFCRDYQTAYKIWKLSSTKGSFSSWGTPKTLPFSNYDSGLAALALSPQELLLVFNQAETTSRHSLVMVYSPDQGETWSTPLSIALGDHKKGDNFSYPFLFLDSLGEIHLLYTWQKKHLHHVEFNKEWVLQKIKKESNISGLQN